MCLGKHKGLKYVDLAFDRKKASKLDRNVFFWLCPVLIFTVKQATHQLVYSFSQKYGIFYQDGILDLPRQDLKPTFDLFQSMRKHFSRRPFTWQRTQARPNYPAEYLHVLVGNWSGPAIRC